MGIQLDYGGFDPAFIGITLRFSNARAWQTFDASRKADAVLQLAELTPDEGFEAISTTSVISHEVRHFHDFLLTPYSARIFKLRIQALVNAHQTLSFLFDDSPNCILTPISTWCRLTDTERQRELSYLPARPGDQQWKPVVIPFIQDETLSHPQSPRVELVRDEALEQLIRAAMTAAQRIEELTYNPCTIREKASFQAWQVFELSGLLVQHQDVEQTRGAKASQFFVDYLLASRDNPYAQMLQLVAGPWKAAGRPLDRDMASAMATWSLLGSYEKDQWKACPSTRFIDLWQYLSKKGIPASVDDLLILFDFWSEQLGLSTVADGLKETRKTFHQLVTLLDDYIKQFYSARFFKIYGPMLKRVANGIADASDHMATEFNNDPFGYVFPGRYVNDASRFVSPILRIMFEGGGLTISDTQKALERRGYIIQWAAKTGKGDIISSMIEPYAFSEKSFLNPQDVDQLATMIGLTDFLFAESARARFEVQRPGRSYFEGSNTIPIEIQTRKA